MALNTQGTGGNGGIFPFKYCKCGQPGDKARDCNTPKKDCTRFTGEYNWCQKTGHKDHNCFNKKRGKLRIPSNSSGGNNDGTSANDVQNYTDSVSDMFAGMTHCQAAKNGNAVEKSMNNNCLGDSGTTLHITNDSKGMTNKR